jgi:hypothetical protein
MNINQIIQIGEHPFKRCLKALNAGALPSLRSCFIIRWNGFNELNQSILLAQDFFSVCVIARPDSTKNTPRFICNNSNTELLSNELTERIGTNRGAVFNIPAQFPNT